MSSIEQPYKNVKEGFTNPDSYWLDHRPVSGSGLTIDPEKFKFDNEKIADALLNEFIHTSPEQKKKFRPLIIQWLSENDLALNDNENFYELRDLIYEMF
jgi:hypothetical protein